MFQIIFAQDKGFEMGVIQGREEGAASKSLEIAKAMLPEGVDPTIISKCTDLAKAKVVAL